MHLVLQGKYNNECQQACLAMLNDISIEEVISIVGLGRMGLNEHLIAKQHFKITPESNRINITGVGSHCFNGILRNNNVETLWLSIYDYLDINYGHAVLYHKGDLYDPYLGLNPSYVWSRHISFAALIEGRC